MFTAAKDALTGAAARKFLSQRIARYGHVRDLRIDSRRKTFSLVCELIGETEPIAIEIGRYEVEEDDGKTYVRPLSCRCDRAWIAHLLEDHVQGRRFELPAWAKTVL